MASWEVVPPILRSRMPVRSRIQAALVSMVTERSSLVTTLSGTEIPQPVTMPPRVVFMTWWSSLSDDVPDATELTARAAAQPASSTWMPMNAASARPAAVPIMPPVLAATANRAPST